MMRRIGAAVLCALLGACGSISLPNLSDLLPFGSSGPRERNQTPDNSTEYRCANGARFYVRQLDKDAVWLMLPDRHVRLEKSGAGYATGRLTLRIDGNSATVQDPPTSYADCKVPGAEKEAADAAK